MRANGFASILVAFVILLILGASSTFLLTKKKPLPPTDISETESSLQSSNSQKALNSQPIQAESITPRLDKKITNEPNYLVYLRKELLEYGQKNPSEYGAGDFYKYKYTLMGANEDGSEKKKLFEYIRNGRIQGQDSGSFGEMLGKSHFLLRRITGDNEDMKVFNKNGGDETTGRLLIEILNKVGKYDETFPLGILVDTDYQRALELNGDFIAYIKNQRDFKSPTSIAVFNLKTNSQKEYQLDKNYNENGPLLYLSPDNQKLYVCACTGFYFKGSSLGFWEVDLGNDQIIPLTNINQLGFRDAIFRSDPNSVYVSKFESFDRKENYPDDLSQRSKRIFKIDLDSKKQIAIDFGKYFERYTISKSGNFALAYYGKWSNGDSSEGWFIKNLKNKEEFSHEGINSLSNWWSDNDKLALIIGNRDSVVPVDKPTSEKIDLYVFNPVDKSKTLIDTIEVKETGKCCTSNIDVIGWIH